MPAKGMKWREQQNCAHWTVPYLPLDPQDVGREYEADVIRINSQSGKGGIGYLMETRYGYNIPAAMRESFGYLVKGFPIMLIRNCSRKKYCKSLQIPMSI